jgi:hypothetical protein
MKKILSLMLALTMIIGVFAPMIASAEAVDPKEQLFNDLRDKFKDIRNESDASDALNIIIKLNAKREEIYNSLSESDKQYLESLGISKDVFGEIVSILKNNEALLKKIIKEDELNYNDVKSDINLLINDLYGKTPDLLKERIDKYVPTKEEKVNLFVELVREFIHDKFGTGDYSVKNNKWISLNLEIRKEQIERANDLVEKGNPFTDYHLTIVNNILKSAEKQLGDYLNIAGKLLNKANMIDRKNVDTETPEPEKPSTGGSTGGGGGGGSSSSSTTPSTSTPDPVIEVPTEGAVIGTVGKEHATVTTSAKGTNVQVKEFETVKAIDALRKKAGADRAAVLVIKLDNVKGLDVNVSLPVKVVNALGEKKVDLKVVTSDVEFGLPNDALKEATIPAGAKLELRIAEISKEVEAENADVKRVVDLSLVIVKGSEETVVSTFNAPITVKVDIKGLGNNDKLAVYYLNEEDNTLEFVTGKIQDNKAVLVLEHFSKYVVVESNKTFTDIESHWSKLYVESMAAKNVVGGYDDGTFRPEGKVTRAEFAKMIVNSLELKLEKYDGSFTDVKENDWHADYVATIVKLGVAGGYDDGTFKPNKEITRAEMAVILSNIVDVEVEETEIEALLGQYKDVEAIPAWATEAIAKVAKAKIMQGVNDNFNGGSTTTRAESATAIYRAYNK